MAFCYGFTNFFGNIVSCTKTLQTTCSGDFDVFMTRSVFLAIQRRLAEFPISCNVTINDSSEYYDSDFVVFDITSQEHDKTVQVTILH